MSFFPVAPFNNDMPKEERNTNTGIAVIIVVSILVTFVLLLSVSLCLLCRNFLRNLFSSSTTTAASTTSTFNRNSSNRVSPEFISVLDSLPIFTLTSSVKEKSSSLGVCAVCLSKFQQQDQLRLLPLCCHTFHTHCIDEWLRDNQTCPLCRSSIHASEAEIEKVISDQSTAVNDEAESESFRLEIVSVNDHRQHSISSLSSESTPTLEVDGELEISMNNTETPEDAEVESSRERSMAWEMASSSNIDGWSWLKDYVDRLSGSLSGSTSSAMSFRDSGRFFTESGRQSEVTTSAGNHDLERGSSIGEEISELFRWLSGV